MLVVGLTGGIGAGKSTVAALLAVHGAEVIDVDAVGRGVLRHGAGAYQGVVERFGVGIVGPDGEIDRGILAGRVFGDADALTALNAISHPAIEAELAAQVSLSSAAVVVLDMAVLVETSLGRGLYHTVVVVEAPWPVRLARLIGRGMTESQAVARRDAQATDVERRAMTDHILVNDGDTVALAAAVNALWRKLTSSGRGRP